MLRNKRFHQYNRFYLLSSAILSWIVPLAKIKFWNETAQQEMSAIELLKVVATSDAIVEESLKSPVVWDFNLAALVVFSFISAALFVWLIVGIIRIAVLIGSNRNKSWNNINFIFTEAKGTPFSFFKYIFWNKNIDLQTEEGKHILQHELAHVQEKHSADKLFLHITLIAGWLNPFFWLIRKELNMIHEFIADEKAISDGDTNSFSTMLLKTAYPQHSFALANSFFHSPIKRRLIMFTTSKKPSYSYFRRLMILPLLCFVIVFFSFKANKESSYAGNNLAEIYTVIIDAGHGGNDDGALGANGLKEKDITLALAKLVKNENTNENIKIVLSRENDAFLSPPQRIQLLEKIKPALFISLHINNSSEENKESKENNGPEINIQKGSSALMQQSKILASILSTNLETVFNKPALLKQKEQTIWVLDANKICPSVLLECGYIGSARDMALLSKTDKQTQIAQMLLKTIGQYLSLKENTTTGSNRNAKTQKAVADEISKGNIASHEGTDAITKIKDASDNIVNGITDTPALPKALVVLDTNGFGRLLPKKVIAPELGRLLPKKVIAPERVKETLGEKGANRVVEITTGSQGIVDESVKEPMPDTPEYDFVRVFTKVENPPYYSAGMAAFADYIQSNMQYPKEAIENKKEGAVSIQFIIDEDGNLSNFKKVSDLGFGLEEEAIRLLKKSSGWKSGIQNGRKVPAQIVQQIIFNLPSSKT